MMRSTVMIVALALCSLLSSATASISSPTFAALASTPAESSRDRDLSFVSANTTTSSSSSSPSSSSSLLSASSLSLGAARSIAWSRVTANAAWSPRAGGVVEWYQPDTEFPGAFLLYGLGIYDQDAAVVTQQVWRSTNGQVWTAVAQTAPYTQLYSSITMQDVRGTQYRIQGTNNARNAFSDVFASTNGGRTWTRKTSQRLLPGTRYLGAGIASIRTPNTLLIWGGQRGDGDQNILSDAYWSIDGGSSWELRCSALPWGRRSVHAGLITQMPSGLEVIYHTMGYSQYDTATNTGLYTNDVWISTTFGSTWTPLNARAPWVARGDSQIEMTTNGVMIIVGGISSFVFSDPDLILNDVWASLDGGYSWGLCSDNAPFSNRRFQYTALDTAGYLWLMGGRDDADARLNDVWKSSFSYNDAAKVAAECNLLVPSCGPGLKCLPTSPGFFTGFWGVVCEACPASPVLAATAAAEEVNPSILSTLSNSRPLAIAMSIFVVSFVATVLSLVYVMHKMREGGVAAPFSFLPSSWWNAGNKSNSLSHESLMTDSALDQTSYSIQQ